MSDLAPPQGGSIKTIHHLDELLAALATGERELRLPSGALCYLGAGYVAAMVVEAKKSYPDFILWADAGEDAGAAMAALQCGLTHITICARDAVMEKLRQMAASQGAVMVLPA